MNRLGICSVVRNTLPNERCLRGQDSHSLDPQRTTESCPPPHPRHCSRGCRVRAKTRGLPVLEQEAAQARAGPFSSHHPMDWLPSHGQRMAQGVQESHSVKSGSRTRRWQKNKSLPGGIPSRFSLTINLGWGWGGPGGGVCLPQNLHD